MAVDEQDGPDLTWVEVSSDQNLYQCDLPEAFESSARMRSVVAFDNKSALIEIETHKHKGNDKILVFVLRVLLDVKHEILLKNNEHTVSLLPIVRLLQKATSMVKSENSTMEIFKETPCITEKSFLSFALDASEKIDLDDDIAVMTLVSVICNKISYKSFSELSQDIESVRELVKDPVKPSFSYFVESMLSIIYVLVCDNRNNMIYPIQSLEIMYDVISSYAYRDGCMFPSYRLRQIASIAGNVDKEILLELLNVSRISENYVPDFVPFCVIVNTAEQILSINLGQQDKNDRLRSSSVLYNYIWDASYGTRYNLNVIFMILVGYLRYLATENGMQVVLDDFSLYRDLMSDESGSINQTYCIPVEMLLSTIEFLDLIDSAKSMRHDLVKRILARIKKGYSGTVFNRIGLNNGDRIFDDVKLSMYTCIPVQHGYSVIEDMLSEMSHLIEFFIGVIMDHMCISTKGADGKESYLDNLKMMSMVFAFLTGCMMNKIHESGVKDVIGFDVPSPESGL